jgi:glycosyltransferase involved in cell wall biosynthesis
VRILHVNKFLYRRGGAEAYMLDLAALQEASGHEVAFFSMAHPENVPSRFERYFPERVEFDPPPADLPGKLRGAGRLLWSPAASRGIERVAREFRPDLAHLHNVYHQLSPSVLRPLRRLGIPAVMTLHDYKLACPTYRFVDHGRICEACLPRRYWEPVVRRCNRGSLGASTVNAVEATLHSLIDAYGPVARFVCPSRFLEGKMRQARIDPRRLRWVPNFVDPAAFEPKRRAGGPVVYAGRLSEEKGVDVLIEAVARRPELRLDVAGDGPVRSSLEGLARARGADDRVRFLGRLPVDRLRGVLRDGSVAAVPSRWYENMPLAILEAFASGLPVVGTALGGIPELIDPGGNGLIVPPEDPAALGDALAALAGEPQRALAMGRAARDAVERSYSPGPHVERLEAVYREAMEAAA